MTLALSSPPKASVATAAANPRFHLRPHTTRATHPAAVSIPLTTLPYKPASAAAHTPAATSGSRQSRRTTSDGAGRSANS